MRRALAPDRLWSSRDFFDAKLREQAERHHRFHDTAYNLEPNVKQGPGGLRDLQTIAWVAKRHFGADTLQELAAHGFLEARELAQLESAQSWLWRIRFALHLVSGRREDRLLFDHQIRLARLFGYEDATYTLAVEQFMQRYYRTAMVVSWLNELLLQQFREEILADRDAPALPLSRHFQERDECLEATADDVFARNPSALLELFVVLQQNPRLRGVRARTIRLVTQHLWLIDEEFRQNPRNHRLFLEILRAPAGVTHELRRMNLYGVLGRYIPAFGRIVGRMQYDLFHAYTVDAHTLFVVSNLRRFALERYDHEFPKLAQIFRSLPKPELAYLAAIFHDIAKGRGGDHSELGAVDAEAFCLEQGLSRYDARLVAWLVRHHLKLSVTAQKQDIADPQVVNEFARAVGDQVRLDYLYVLTVADVRGTNPKLWNSWKATLFDELYERVKQALRRGLESPLDREELVAETQALARERLAAAGVDAGGGSPRLVDADRCVLPAAFGRGNRLAHALGSRRAAPATTSPLIAVAEHPDRGGATAVLVYTHGRHHSFARATAALDQQGLSIQDARITPTADGGSLDSYLVLEDTGSPITDRDRIAGIERHLVRSLSEKSAAAPAGDPSHAASGAHVHDGDAGDLQRRSGERAYHPRSRRRRPARAALGDRQGILGPESGIAWRQDHDRRRACGRRVHRDGRNRPAARVRPLPGARRCAATCARRARRKRLRRRWTRGNSSNRSFDERSALAPGKAPRELLAALDDCLNLLGSGRARVAEPADGGWRVNEWLRKAVLLYFRTHDSVVQDAGVFRSFDKLPLKYSDYDLARFQVRRRPRRARRDRA